MFRNKAVSILRRCSPSREKRLSYWYTALSLSASRLVSMLGTSTGITLLLTASLGGRTYLFWQDHSVSNRRCGWPWSSSCSLSLLLVHPRPDPRHGVPLSTPYTCRPRNPFKRGLWFQYFGALNCSMTLPVSLAPMSREGLCTSAIECTTVLFWVFPAEL